MIRTKDQRVRKVPLEHHQALLQRRRDGATYREIAEDYGVHVVTMRDIILGVERKNYMASRMYARFGDRIVVRVDQGSHENLRDMLIKVLNDAAIPYETYQE